MSNEKWKIFTRSLHFAIADAKGFSPHIDRIRSDPWLVTDRSTELRQVNFDAVTSLLGHHKFHLPYPTLILDWLPILQQDDAAGNWRTGVQPNLLLHGYFITLDLFSIPFEAEKLNPVVSPNTSKPIKQWPSRKAFNKFPKLNSLSLGIRT